MRAAEFLFGIVNISIAMVLIVIVLAILSIPRLFLAGVVKHAGMRVKKALQVFFWAFLLLLIQNVVTIVFDFLNPGHQYPIQVRLVVSVIGYSMMLYSFIQPVQALVRSSGKVRSSVRA